MKNKFRAWDKYQKKMFRNVNPIFDADGNLDFIIYEYGNTGHDMIEIDLKKWDSAMLYHYDEGIPVVIMQYTDLKDSNGVDIYEGDVVEFCDFDSLRTGGNTSDKTRKAKVVFMQGGYFVKDGDYEALLYDALINDSELTIIGNIYQNKELLEGE